MAEEHFYYSVNMHGLEVRNHRMHLLATDLVAPNEGDLWFNTTDHVARVQDNTETRNLFNPDDDFYNRLAAKTVVVDDDELLIADSEDTYAYKRMTKADLVLGLGLVSNAFSVFHAEAGTTTITASGEDTVYFVGDGDIIQTSGDIVGVNEISLIFNTKAANLVFAGPSSGGLATPTFRAIVDDDMPSSYNATNWDAAYTHSQAITGNPHGITMVDIGYTVVTEISDPGSDGNLVTEQGIKEYVDALVIPVTYYGNVITTNTGTYVSGDIDSVSTVDDADVYEVTEVVGVPGYDISIDFVDVLHITNQIVCHVWYSGGAGHTVNMEMWNYTGTPQWDVIGTIPESSDYTWHEFDITNPSDYINGSNEASIRFYHITSGNITHSVYIDYAVLKYQPAGGGGGVTDHGSLSGLQDDDHKIYALLDGRLNDILLIDTISEYTPDAGVAVEAVSFKDGDAILTATNKLYFDGAADTYISETSANYLQTFVGSTDDSMVRVSDKRTSVGKQIDGAIPPGRFAVNYGNFYFRTMPYPSAPTAALIETSGNLSNGDYRYLIFYVTDEGDTGTHNLFSNTVTVDPTHQQIELTDIPVADPSINCIARKIYRMLAGGNVFLLYLAHTINDNVTTSWTDNVPDSSLVLSDGSYRKKDESQAGFYIDAGGNEVYERFFYADTYTTILGKYAAQSNTTGNSLVAIGAFAARDVTTGTSYVAIGYSALLQTTSGSGCIAIGYAANYNPSGSEVISIGTYSNTVTGGNPGYQVGIGGYAGGAGNNSVAVGYTALRYFLGVSNVALGYGTMVGNATPANNTGQYNTAVGHLVATDLESGDYGIYLGAYAGDNVVSGDRNIIIGSQLDASAIDVSYEFRLGWASIILLEGSMVGGSQWIGSAYEARFNILNEYTADTGVTVDGSLIKDYSIYPDGADVDTYIDHPSSNRIDIVAGSSIQLIIDSTDIQARTIRPYSNNQFALGATDRYWTYAYIDVLRFKDPAGTNYSEIYTTSGDTMEIKPGNGIVYIDRDSATNTLRVYDNIGATYIDIKGDAEITTTATDMSFQDGTTGPHTLSELYGTGGAAWWSRAGAILSPSNSGDSIKIIAPTAQIQIEDSDDSKKWGVAANAGIFYIYDYATSHYPFQIGANNTAQDATFNIDYDTVRINNVVDTFALNVFRVTQNPVTTEGSAATVAVRGETSSAVLDLDQYGTGGLLRLRDETTNRLLLSKAGVLSVDVIDEVTAGVGVTIENITFKDGGVDESFLPTTTYSYAFGSSTKYWNQGFVAYLYLKHASGSVASAVYANSGDNLFLNPGSGNYVYIENATNLAPDTSYTTALGISTRYWTYVYSDYIRLKNTAGTNYLNMYQDSGDSLWMNPGSGLMYMNRGAVNNNIRTYNNLLGSAYYSNYGGVAAEMYANSILMWRLNANGLTLETGTTVNEIESILTDDTTHIPNSAAVVAAIVAGSAYTFENGLTEAGGTVKLGGALTGSTTITTTGYTYTIEGVGGTTSMRNTYDLNSWLMTVYADTGYAGTSGYSRITLTNTYATLQLKIGASTFKSISIASSSMTVTDSNDSLGLQYAADYSTAGAVLGDRWIPDKGYVDSVAGGTYTFSNGISEAGGAVTLGGDFTGHTVFSNATPGTYSLSIGDPTNYLGVIVLRGTSLGMLSMNNGTITLGAGSGSISIESESYVDESIEFNADDKQLRGPRGVGQTFHLAVRDTDGSSYTNFITFTAGTTPTMTFPQSGGGTSNFLNADGGWTVPPGTGVAFGTTTQIPYMNAGGTDFIYSANLAYNGTTLSVGTGIGTTNLAANYLGLGTAASATYALYSVHASTPGWFERSIGTATADTPYAAMALQLTTTSTGVNAGSFFYFKYEDSTAVVNNIGAFGFMRDGHNQTGELQIYSYYQGTTRYLRLLSGGTSVNTYLTVNGITSGGDAALNFSQVENTLAVVGYDDSGAGLQLETGGSFSTTPALYIGSVYHNVCIGAQTDSTTHELIVTGATVAVRLESTTGDADLEIYGADSGDDSSIFLNYVGGSLGAEIRWQGSSGDSLFLLNGGGTTGIEITTAGRIYMVNMLNSSGANYVYWNSGGQLSYATTSDIRLKKNISPWKPDSLGFLKGLPLIKFDRIDGSNKGQIGWNGTVMKDLMPSMTWLDDEGYVNIKDAHMIYHAHRAINQITERVETNEQKIARLEEKVIELKNQITNHGS